MVISENNLDTFASNIVPCILSNDREGALLNFNLMKAFLLLIRLSARTLLLCLLLLSSCLLCCVVVVVVVMLVILGKNTGP